MNSSDANQFYTKQWNYQNTGLDHSYTSRSLHQAQNSTALTTSATGEISVQAPNTAMFQKGQILTGQILDLIHNDVKLSLSDGTILNAILSDTIPVSIGDTSHFVVSESFNHSLVLKYLSDQPPSTIEPSVEKALEEAGLPKNDRNLAIVHELIKEQMSIDKNSISSAVRQSIAHKDIPYETLVKLLKYDLPVTSANASGLEAALAGKHLLCDQLPQMISTLADLLSENPTSFTTDEPVTVTAQSTQVIDKDSIPAVNNTVADNPPSLNTEQNIAAPTVSFQAEDLINALDLDLESLQINNNTVYKEQISSILKNKFLLSADTIYNKKKGLNKDGLSQYYRKLSSQIDSLVKFLHKQTNESSPSLLMQAMNQAEQIKDTLDFMQNLNHLFGYVQLPAKDKEDASHGELFVYTNQKQKKETDGPTSLLLHLTMSHLGEIDFHLVLAKQHLTANITVADHTVLDLINAHLYELTDKLEKKNYIVSASVSQKEKISNPFHELFGSQNQPKTAPVRYSFDKRA